MRMLVMIFVAIAHAKSHLLCHKQSFSAQFHNDHVCMMIQAAAPMRMLVMIFVAIAHAKSHLLCHKQSFSAQLHNDHVCMMIESSVVVVDDHQDIVPCLSAALHNFFDVLSHQASWPVVGRFTTHSKTRNSAPPPISTSGVSDSSH
jgi:hypothetical protein